MKNKIFQSISIKISLLSTIFTFIVLIAMGLAIQKHVIDHFNSQNLSQLNGKVYLIEKLLEKNPEKIEFELNKALVGHNNLSIQIKLPDDKTIYQSKNIPINFNEFIKNKNKTSSISWSNNLHSYQGVILQKNILINSKIQNVKITAIIETTDNFQFLHFFKRKLILIGGRIQT